MGRFIFQKTPILRASTLTSVSELCMLYSWGFVFLSIASSKFLTCPTFPESLCLYSTTGIIQYLLFSVWLYYSQNAWRPDKAGNKLRQA